VQIREFSFFFLDWLRIVARGSGFYLLFVSMLETLAKISDFLGSWYWLPFPLYVLYWYWVMFVSYPRHLQKLIRSGKAWLYIPASFRGLRRFAAYPVSLLLFLLVSFSISGALNGLVGFGVPGLLIFAIPAGAFVWSCRRYWLRYRYLQQQDAFFYEYDLLIQRYDREGKQIVESDIRNLAMYEHQNSLRQADESGQLLRYVRNKAKGGKEFLSKMREKLSDMDVSDRDSGGIV